MIVYISLFYCLFAKIVCISTETNGILEKTASEIETGEPWRAAEFKKAMKSLFMLLHHESLSLNCSLET